MIRTASPHSRPLRRALAALASVVVVAALSACSTGASGTSSADDASASGTWTYTDDTGHKVTLEHRPTRVVAFADYALGLFSLGVKPVGVFGRVPVKTDTRFADVDMKGVSILGNSYGEIDLEKLAEAQPDLIVTGTYPTDRKGTLDTKSPLYAFADLDQQKKIEKIAPVVAIKIGGKGIDVITSMNRLATALGAKESRIAAAKKQFDTASARLTAAAKESGVEVTQMYADESGIYVVKPEDEPQTQLYHSLGVDYTNLNPGGKYYWDEYSWENASKMMTGDVILVNVEGYQKADLEKQPTFADDKALKAGQVYAWQDAALDYASQAKHMDEFAKILENAKRV